MLTLALALKTAFSLGELSGSIKQMLSLAKNDDFVYELKSTCASSADQSRVVVFIVRA
jgi:hypothetical protein